MTKLKIAGIALLIAGSVVAIHSFASAQDAPTPLAVTCSGAPATSTNSIAWTASATGGNTSAPYAYLWSGDQVAGDMSSTVNATYDSSGTYSAFIQVTDASSSVATSSCSAATPLVTTSTSTPTSTTPTADLTISQSVSTTTPNPGDTIDYMLTVSALGPSTSTGVTANDLLPSALTFESSTPSVGAYDSSTGLWTIGDMASGSNATLELTAMVNASTSGQTITNTANVSESASSTETNLSTTSSTAVFTVATPTSTLPSAGLWITKSIDNASPTPSSTVNYTITVGATGPATSAAAMVTDMLPSGETFENAVPSMGTYSSSTGQWTIGDLTPSSTAQLMIMALINPDDDAGQTITNTANVSEASSVMNTNASTSASAALTVQPVSTSTGTGGGGGGTPTSTPTSTTPFMIACDYSVGSSPSTITWNATASGGTAPYTYLWTGDDVPTSSTDSTVTITYPAAGAYFINVEGMDSASSTASAPCSVSIGSTGVSGGGGGTSTSTMPTNQTLDIGPRGAFDATRMLVTSIGSGSFQGMVWGLTYTINWTRARPVLAIGDKVDVVGRVTSSSPMTVNATSVTK